MRQRITGEPAVDARPPRVHPNTEEPFMVMTTSKPASKMPTIGGLHHYTYKCRSAEETRHFYEDVLGLPLAHVMEVRDLKATTGELVSFIHLFFRMGDGSYLAFFDLGDGKLVAKDPNTEQFTLHIALHVAGETALQQAIARLRELGVEFHGPLDQEGFVRSIYLTDPNGVRLELTYQLPGYTLEGFSPESEGYDAKGREILKRWAEEHQRLASV
jgi:catechol 2,3-dioxygenase-like lactoylglutathione lyase family enzyme